MIPPLEPHDQHHLNAAQGWIELGNQQEADLELEQIAPELHDHPGVLEVRWHIYAKAKKWDRALEMASSLIELVPDISLGWRHRSYCLHELKRTEGARDNLVRVVENFADDPILPYNLACYECQLGRLEQAKVWLEKACKLGGRKQIKLMALQDPDLEPLWEEMRQAK